MENLKDEFFYDKEDLPSYWDWVSQSLTDIDLYLEFVSMLRPGNQYELVHNGLDAFFTYVKNGLMTNNDANDLIECLHDLALNRESYRDYMFDTYVKDEEADRATDYYNSYENGKCV